MVWWVYRSLKGPLTGDRVAEVAGLKDLVRLTKSRFKKFYKRDNDLELIFHIFFI